jgi:hypothetical protein
VESEVCYSLEDFSAERHPLRERSAPICTLHAKRYSCIVPAFEASSASKSVTKTKSRRSFSEEELVDDDDATGELWWSSEPVGTAKSAKDQNDKNQSPRIATV